MATTVQEWKNVSPNRKDNLSIERAIKTLDRQAQIQNTQIRTDVNNIIDGTTAIPFTWAAYVGPMLLFGVLHVFF